MSEERRSWLITLFAIMTVAIYVIFGIVKRKEVPGHKGKESITVSYMENTDILLPEFGKDGITLSYTEDVTVGTALTQGTDGITSNYNETVTVLQVG